MVSATCTTILSSRLHDPCCHTRWISLRKHLFRQIKPIKYFGLPMSTLALSRSSHPTFSFSQVVKIISRPWHTAHRMTLLKHNNVSSSQRPLIILQMACSASSRLLVLHHPSLNWKRMTLWDSKSAKNWPNCMKVSTSSQLVATRPTIPQSVASSSCWTVLMTYRQCFTMGGPTWAWYKMSSESKTTRLSTLRILTRPTRQHTPLILTRTRCWRTMRSLDSMRQGLQLIKHSMSGRQNHRSWMRPSLQPRLFPQLLQMLWTLCQRCQLARPRSICMCR